MWRSFILMSWTSNWTIEVDRALLIAESLVCFAVCSHETIGNERQKELDISNYRIDIVSLLLFC